MNNDTFFVNFSLLFVNDSLIELIMNWLVLHRFAKCMTKIRCVTIIVIGEWSYNLTDMTGGASCHIQAATCNSTTSQFSSWLI